MFLYQNYLCALIASNLFTKLSFFFSLCENPRKGNSVLECPVQHAKFCNIFQPGDHISKGMKLCFVVIQSTMGRFYKAMVSWSDLFFLCEIYGQMVVCRTGRTEILRAMFPFSVYFNRKWRLPQENLWIYCFIVIL